MIKSNTPKYFIFIFSILFFFFSVSSFAQKKNTKKNVDDEDEEMEKGKLPEGVAQDETINYLEIQCKTTEPVKDKNGKVDSENVGVVLYRVYNDDGSLYKVAFADEKGKCAFRLAFQKKYQIIISRKGYVSKILNVDTTLPKDLNTAYIFPADISMFKQLDGFNSSVFKDPVAKIVYSFKTKQFEYDELYNIKLSPSLKKANSDYIRVLK